MEDYLWIYKYLCLNQLIAKATSPTPELAIYLFITSASYLITTLLNIISHSQHISLAIEQRLICYQIQQLTHHIIFYVIWLLVMQGIYHNVCSLNRNGSINTFNRWISHLSIHICRFVQFGHINRDIMAFKNPNLAHMRHIYRCRWYEY